MAKVIFYPNMKFLLDEPSGPVGRDLAKRGERVRDGARRQVGVKSGALRASIHKRHKKDPRGQYVWVGSELPYAYLHHEGSRPHIIAAKRASVLKFARGGQIVRTPVVRHPGTKPNRYLSDNLKNAIY